MERGSRALAVPRFSGGRKVPPPIQRMRSDDLLAAVFPDQVACAENLTGEIRIPDHPLVNETIANCLHEAMDLDGLNEILDRMEEGTLRTVAVDTPEPSPFCHEILNANPYAYLDDAPLEERRTRAVQLRRTLSPEDAASMARWIRRRSLRSPRNPGPWFAMPTSCTTRCSPDCVAAGGGMAGILRRTGTRRARSTVDGRGSRPSAWSEGRARGSARLDGLDRPVTPAGSRNGSNCR